MSLNDIQIPPALLAELYGTTIIIDEKINTALMPDAGKKNVEKDLSKRNALGENRRNILIAVSYPGVPVIPDTDLELLTGILGACKLGLADVTVVNIADSNEKWGDLKTTYNPRQVMLFGVNQHTLDLPVRFPEFQVQAISGQQFLSSPALSEIKEDKLLKSKLWVTLQKLFNL